MCNVVTKICRYDSESRDIKAMHHIGGGHVQHFHIFSLNAVKFRVLKAGANDTVKLNLFGRRQN
jgi:hypothetical protein